MSVNIVSAIIYIIEALRKCGVIDSEELSYLISALGKKIFICSRGKTDVSIMAEAIKNEPILLECERRRAYSIAKNIEAKIGKTVKKYRVGKRIQPIYLLLTEEQEEIARKFIEREESKKEVSDPDEDGGCCCGGKPCQETGEN